MHKKICYYILMRCIKVQQSIFVSSVCISILKSWHLSSPCLSCYLFVFPVEDWTVDFHGGGYLHASSWQQLVYRTLELHPRRQIISWAHLHELTDAQFLKWIFIIYTYWWRFILAFTCLFHLKMGLQMFHDNHRLIKVYKVSITLNTAGIHWGL